MSVFRAEMATSPSLSERPLKHISWRRSGSSRSRSMRGTTTSFTRYALHVPMTAMKCCVVQGAVSVDEHQLKPLKHRACAWFSLSVMLWLALHLPQLCANASPWLRKKLRLPLHRFGSSEENSSHSSRYAIADSTSLELLSLEQFRCVHVSPAPAGGVQTKFLWRFPCLGRSWSTHNFDTPRTRRLSPCSTQIFRFLAQSECFVRKDGVSDAEKFVELIGAMKTIGLSGVPGFIEKEKNGWS